MGTFPLSRVCPLTLREDHGSAPLAHVIGTNSEKKVIILPEPNLNYNKIREKTVDIKEALALLRNYENETEENFIANPEAIGAVRYYFIVLIEATMNIANHICSRLLEKAPANYADTFLLLGKNNLIKSELAANLAQMARFRNLLVHGYAKIDDRKMLKIIREDLDDVEDFINELSKIINHN